MSAFDLFKIFIDNFMEQTHKWNRFLKELANLYFFWLFGIIFFTLFRILFITIFSQQIEGSVSFSEISKALLMGLKFDSTAVAYFMLLPFLSLLFLSPFNQFGIIKVVRKIHQVLFIVLATLICVVTINYFGEYHDQFNNFLFLALYDDQKAVLKTVLKDYHPILNLVCLLGTIILGIFLFRYFESKTKLYNWLEKINFQKSQLVIVFLSIVLFIFAIRGSFSSVPAIRKWAGVSKDAFLNKTIVNPFRSLKYALEDFNSLNLVDGTNPYLEEKDFYAQFPQDLVTDVLEKKAMGSQIEKPKQIFLIVMESYDSWPLMDQYSDFGVATHLKEIAKKGTQFTHFLPASNTTFNSFASVVTNVPNCGVNISHLGTVNEPFQTSIFKQFKKLGYEINFFYGGFLSWENIGEFTKYQGVDRIFSGVDAGGKSDSGDWGIEDEKLFDLVVKNTDKTKYSLNVILTSSYHPPYTIDLESKGFPYKSLDDLPAGAKKHFDNGMTLKELGHLWYGDKAIGDFVKTAEQKYTNGLFCFTGDHYGRRFINHHPNLYEKSSVSFIMYGKSIPKSINTTPGSHIDIMPTLIEMIAPKDFTYYSFGSSLFTPQKKEAFGFYKMIHENDLYYFPKEAKVEKINMNTFSQNTESQFNYLQNYNAMMSLAWHYTMKGNSLKKVKTNKKTIQ